MTAYPFEPSSLPDTPVTIEEVWHAFLDAAPVGVAIFARDLKYLQASRRWIEDFGLTGREIIGRCHYDLFPDLPERWKEVHRRCLGGATERAEADPYPRADGQTDWIDWEVRPWHRRNGEIGGIVIFSAVVTERVLVLERIRESEEHLARAQRLGRIGSAVGDLLSGTSRWSDEHFRIYGIPPRGEGLSPKEFFTFVHPDDRERVRQVRNLNVGGIDTPPIEFRIFRPDGTIRWIRREAELTRDAAGMPVRLIATQQDITDQVDRESELRRRQRSLVRAQRMGRIGSVEVDLVTRTVTWSDEIYRIYGRDLAQGPANLETFLAHVHPDDRHLIEEFRAEHEHGIVIGPHDFRILRADGELRWIHREVELERDASGRPVTLFATEQDITETRLANEELAKSYVRLNHAQSVGRVGSIEIDLHTGKANWSETMYRLHGLDPANTPPSDELLLSMVYPEDRQTIVAARAKNLGGAQTDPIEFRIMRADGETRWMYREAKVIHDSDGAPASVIVLLRDITERRKLEDELRRKAEHLQLAQRIGHIGSVEVDMVTGDSNWSDEMYRIYGIDPLARKPGFETFLSLVHPDDRDRVIELNERSSRGEGLEAIDFRIHRFDGEVRWIRLNQETGTDSRRAIRLFGTHQDITEIKNAENQRREAKGALTAIMDYTVDGLITIDARGIVLTFSKPAERIFGYSAAEVVGNNVKMLVPSPHHDAHDKYIANYLATREAKIIGIGREVKGRRKNGTLFPMDLSIGEIPDGPFGQSFVGVVRDITLRKQIEAQLIQAQKMEAVGQLTGGVAHDFNNLLAVILGRLQMIDEEVTDRPELRTWIRMCIRTAERGASLTKSLLVFSREQALSPVEVDLREVIGDTEEMLRRLLGEAYDIRVDAAPDLWRIEVDQGQLQNAVLNLVLNARDAMPKGGTIVLSTANLVIGAQQPPLATGLHPGEYVVLSVADTGSGIAPEILPHVFEPFFTTKEVGKGSGLGLSMVYGFVKKSDGDIAIESEVGTGTTIRIYLPRKVPAMAKPIAKVGDRPRATGGETILVIEDNGDLRLLIRYQLEKSGYRVLEAPDGPEGLRVLAERPNIDLLLSDIVLPGGIAGPEIAKKALVLRPDLKILFMSGYNDLQQAIEQSGSGMGQPARILQKPFQRQELIAQIQAALA